MKTPEQMANFWKNISSGDYREKPLDELRRNSKRSVLYDWSDSQLSKPQPARKPQAAPSNTQIDQLNARTNYLFDKVKELQAKKKDSSAF